MYFTNQLEIKLVDRKSLNVNIMYIGNSRDGRNRRSSEREACKGEGAGAVAKLQTHFLQILARSR